MKILFPETIQIETTILCNGKCSFCPQREVKRRPVYMEEELIYKIIDQSRNRGILYRPFLQNEPFTEKRMPEIIRYIKKDATARVELNSNAGLLNEKKSTEVIEAGLDLIRFSLDAFSKEVYDKTGRGDDYEKVKNNILQFIEIKNKINPEIEVYVRMVEMDFNKHEKKDYSKFWEKYADHVQITPLYSWPWTGQDFCVPKPCPKIRNEMFFLVNGQAVLCCWDYMGRGVTGDINNNTVEEIWNGPINNKYRELLNRGGRSEITLCSRCDGYRNYDFSNWQGY